MFWCSIRRPCAVYVKQLFVPKSVTLFSSDAGNQFNNKNLFRGRRRQKVYSVDAGIRHTMKIMEETTPKGSKRLIDSEYDEVDENEFDDKILKSGQVYDEMIKEETTHKKYIINKIIERKYFRPPPEPNLLTYAAKEQVKYLHETDPKTWTPQKLADSFPISVAGVKKLLKNKLHDLSEEGIAKHDSAVCKKWDQMRNRELNGGPINLGINKKRLLKEWKHNEEVPSLSKPSTEWKTARMLATSELLRSPPREFENLLHIGKKEKKENGLTLPFSNVVASDRINNHISKSTRLHENENISIEEFKKNLKQNLSKNSEVKEFDKWMSRKDRQPLFEKSEPIPKQSPHDDIIEYFNGNIQKYKHVSMPNLKWDVHKDVSNENNKEAYLYDANLGYQRPYGSYYNKKSDESGDEKEKNLE